MPRRMPRSSCAAARLLALAACIGAGAVTLAGCGYSGSPSSQVKAWVAQNSFLTNEQQVIADVHSVERAAATGSALQLRTVCGGLSSDAGTLYSSLPTPDHQLTNELGQALQGLYNAAESCAVVSSTHLPEVRRALEKIASAVAGIDRARAILLRSGVSSPYVRAQ